MTTSTTSIYTPIASSGQGGVTSSKPAVFGETGQSSGDFLGMLMGALGQIVPVTPTVPVPKEMLGTSQTDVSIFLNPVVQSGDIDTQPPLNNQTVMVVQTGNVVLQNELNTENITGAVGDIADVAVNTTDITTDQEVLKDQAFLSSIADLELNDDVQNGDIPDVFDARFLQPKNNQNGILPDMIAQNQHGVIAGQILSPKTSPANIQSGVMKTEKQSLNPLQISVVTQTDATGYMATFLVANDVYKPGSNAAGAGANLTSSTVDSGLKETGDPNFLGSSIFEETLSNDLSFSNEPTDPGAHEFSRAGSNIIQGGHIGHGGYVSSISPATVAQAVVLHLQTLAQNRDTRSLTLHLDPPELGKMQVKMSYGRDKTVRADILVEKPDTLRLMENDLNALKSALETTGLSVDQGALNFSLADQGAFGRPDDDIFMSNTGYQNDENGSEKIAGFEFKSSEEWSVDPSTGITRYNIVV